MRCWPETSEIRCHSGSSATDDSLRSRNLWATRYVPLMVKCVGCDARVVGSLISAQRTAILSVFRKLETIKFISVVLWMAKPAWMMQRTGIFHSRCILIAVKNVKSRICHVRCRAKPRTILHRISSSDLIPNL